jgi:2-octaprenyl-6-methoxyphenol hydroxylase
MALKSIDILISGGGVAGLTAAAAFGAAGFAVVIVDPVAPITDVKDQGADLRTTAFLQPARDFLIQSQLWDQLKTFAEPLQEMRIVDAHGEEPVGRSFHASDISEMPFGWNLPNWLLRRELIARLHELPNVAFRPGVGFKDILTRTNNALVRLSDGTRIDARLVIGADGRGSPVRGACGISVKTTRYGQKALTFAVTYENPHDNVSTEIHMSGGPFTLVPLPDHKGRPCSAVVWMDKNDKIDCLKNLDAAEFDIAASERSAHLYGSLKCVSRRTSWQIVSQIADRMSAERVALIAEAAHVMPPIGAQGLNMSLADLSCLLDLALAHPNDLGGQSMLDAYHKARHGDVKLRVKGIDILNRASIAGHPIIQDLRAMGVQAIHDVAPIRKHIMQMGLGAKA